MVHCLLLLCKELPVYQVALGDAQMVGLLHDALVKELLRLGMLEGGLPNSTLSADLAPVEHWHQALVNGRVN